MEPVQSRPTGCFIQYTSWLLSSFYYRHHRRLTEVMFSHLSVCLWAGYLKKFRMDPDEIWWTGLVCAKDELIRIWWRWIKVKLVGDLMQWNRGYPCDPESIMWLFAMLKKKCRLLWRKDWKKHRKRVKVMRVQDCSVGRRLTSWLQLYNFNSISTGLLNLTRNYNPSAISVKSIHSPEKKKHKAGCLICNHVNLNHCMTIFPQDEDFFFSSYYHGQ